VWVASKPKQRNAVRSLPHKARGGESEKSDQHPGQFAAIADQKVANHPFAIKTDNPNVEVSWQVTAAR